MTISIIAAKRTPLGAFRKTLSDFSAPELGSHAIKAALKQSNLKASDIDECIMGQVLTAGSGQAPARQAALGAGLNVSTPCTTINKVCGSGLKAVMLASDALKLGQGQYIVCGGQESMTQAPWMMDKKKVPKEGEIPRDALVDCMLKDGLVDPYKNKHMGLAGELCAKEYKASREDQDAYAVTSYTRAQSAIKNKLFADEIEPLAELDHDESALATDFEKIPNLKTVFDANGTITAANASSINDGAAALILTNQKTQNALAEVVGHATFATEPDWFTTAPVGAIKKLLSNHNLSTSDIDFFEINEAFSIVTMAAIKDLGLDPEKVNPLGGAVALGHPIGASGARILTTLIYCLKRENKKYGVASLCLGGGEAVALLIKNVS